MTSSLLRHRKTPHNYRHKFSILGSSQSKFLVTPVFIRYNFVLFRRLVMNLMLEQILRRREEQELLWISRSLTHTGLIILCATIAGIASNCNNILFASGVRCVCVVVLAYQTCKRDKILDPNPVRTRKYNPELEFDLKFYKQARKKRKLRLLF